MRAVAVAPPFGLESIQIVERPVPEPGAGEVLVRMLAASLNYCDMLLMRGLLTRRLYASASITPLSDGCGVIEAIGEGVTRFAVGDRVITQFFQGWISGPPTRAKLATTLGAPLPGTASEYQTFSEQGLVAAPPSLTNEEAATLPCAGLTAWRADRGRSADTWRHRCPAGNGRRIDVRPPVRPDRGLPDDNHLVQ